MPISCHAYQPPCQLAIMPIFPHTYQPSCLSIIMPISNHTYWLSCLSTIMPFCHHISYQYSKILKLPFKLFVKLPVPSCPDWFAYATRVLHCQFHLLDRCGHMLNPLTSNYQSILHWNQLHYLWFHVGQFQWEKILHLMFCWHFSQSLCKVCNTPCKLNHETGQINLDLCHFSHTVNSDSDWEKYQQNIKWRIFSQRNWPTWNQR